jgi:hypothetical protein
MDNREIEVPLPAVKSNMLAWEAVPLGLKWVGCDAALTVI